MTRAHLTWNTDLPLKEDTSQAQTQTSSAVVQCKQRLSRSLNYPLKEENQFLLYILAFNLSNSVVIVFKYLSVMIIVFQVHVPNGDVVIGAGVPLNRLIKFLEDQATVVSGYKVLADHVRKVKVDHTSKI